MPAKAIVTTIGLLAAIPSTAFVRQRSDLSYLRQDTVQVGNASAERGPIEWIQKVMGGGEHAQQEIVPLEDTVALEDTCNDNKMDREGVASLFFKGDQLRVSSGDHIGKEVEAETFLQDDNMWRVTTTDGKKIKVKSYDLQKRIFETRIGPDGRPHTKSQFEKASWHDQWKTAETSAEMRYNAAGQAWTEARFVKHYPDCAWTKWNQAPSVQPSEPLPQAVPSFLQEDAESFHIAPVERGPIEWVQSLMGAAEHAKQETMELKDTCNDVQTTTGGIAPVFLKGDALRVSSGDHIGKEVEAETFLQDDEMWRVTTTDGKKVKVKASDLQKRMFETRIGPDGRPHTKSQFEKASWHDQWKHALKSAELRYNAAGQAWTEDRFVEHYGECAWKKWNQAPNVEPAEPAE